MEDASMEDEQTLIERSLKHFTLLQSARTSLLPGLYLKIAKESPIVKASDDSTRPLVDLLTFVVLTKGDKDFQRVVGQRKDITLDTLAKLAEMTIRPMTPDKRDLEIIKLLLRDPLTTAAEIGRKLGWHKSTVSSRLIPLTWSRMINCYPWPDWHYFGIIRRGFTYRCAKIPTVKNPRLYSRFLLRKEEDIKIYDHWSFPQEQEKFLLDYYQDFEAQGLIQDLEVEEIYNAERLWNSMYFTENTKPLPDIGMEMKDWLEGREDKVAHNDVISQKIDYVHAPRYETFDVQLLNELWWDFVLQRSRKDIATKLSISAPTVSRRIEKWQEDKTVFPMLTVGYREGTWQLGPALSDIIFLTDIEKKEKLKGVLRFFPISFLYEVKIGTQKRVKCVLSLTEPMQKLLHTLHPFSDIEDFYQSESMRRRRGQDLFKTFDFNKGEWMPPTSIFS